MNENEEKKLKEELGKEQEPSEFDLLNEVKKLKETSVPKEEYDKLLAEKKKLMRDFVYGGGQESKTEDTVDLGKIRNNLFTDKVEDLSNRDFWKNVITLRKERLEKDGVDIFLPKGEKTRYTRDDYEKANALAETVSSMLEDSEENPQLFSVLFNEALS